MAKLYPPYINGTIPAFYHAEGTTKIVVPFTMNRAVAPAEVAGFALKIKTINGDIKGVLRHMQELLITSNASVTFSTDMTFLVGQYYKVQLAYIDKSGVIGYYSTVGIIKCTTKPIVAIEGLEFGRINSHNYSYTGTYSQLGGDVTEKMYSYRFVLYDSDNNIIKDSGEKLHNTSLDNVSYESHEEFLISQDLEMHRSYYIQFTVTTTNQLQVHSQKYRIAQRRSISSDIDAALIAGTNFNNGYIELTLHDEKDPVISGTFLISRASSKNGYHWEEIKRFDLHSIPPDSWSYRDFTVEQGISYKYSLQQYNAQAVYSDRIVSNTVTVDFEDMFLYDGERQLKIRFNPKVSTFKNSILESKTDTIGSQYPFISRNGNVHYKEFALSGLISYWSDEEENFINMTDLGLDGFSNTNATTGRYKTTNLVDYNLAAERIFKIEVLEWLNNGEVKLFKSPAEGNFLVRIMNVSLSPTDSLSRMLHSFSASAYEVAEFNNDNLSYYGFVDPNEVLETQTRWVTVDIKTAVQNYLKTTGKSLENAIGDEVELITRPTIQIDFLDMVPGSHVVIDSEDIQMGVTGAYHYQIKSDTSSINSIKFIIDSVNEGQLTYGYLAQAVTVFGLINDIQLVDTPIQQFIGHDYLNYAQVWNSSLHLYEQSTELFDALNDVRTTVLNVAFLRAEKRPIETLFIPENFDPTTKQAFIDGEDSNYLQYDYYTDMYCTKLFDWSKADPLTLYRIRFRANTAPFSNIKGSKYYIDANLNKFSELTNICIDGNTKQMVMYNDEMFKLYVNESEIDLEEIEKYYVNHREVLITNVSFGPGVLVEISYAGQIKVFNVEQEYSKYPALYQAKAQYTQEVANMINTRAITHYDNSTIKMYYRNYILELNKALDQYREENGLVE